MKLSTLKSNGIFLFIRGWLNLRVYTWPSASPCLSSARVQRGKSQGKNRHPPVVLPFLCPLIRRSARRSLALAFSISPWSRAELHLSVSSLQKDTAFYFFFFLLQSFLCSSLWAFHSPKCRLSILPAPVHTSFAGETHFAFDCTLSGPTTFPQSGEAGKNF